MTEFLLFDIDDTLLDFGKAEAGAVSRTFTKAGLPLSDKILRRYSEINNFVWGELEAGRMTRDEILLKRFSLLFDEFGIAASSEAIQASYEYELGVGHYFVDGAEELLNTLCGRYRLFIVSNGTLSVQERRIKSAGIAKYFEKIFVSEKIGYHKPSREFFETCFAQISGFDRERALIIGDRLSSDILGGINAGIKTCWFNPKHMMPDPDIPADFEIDSLAGLPGLLNKINLAKTEN